MTKSIRVLSSCLCLFAVGTLFVACGDDTSGPQLQHVGTITGRALVAGATDHSGTVMILEPTDGGKSLAEAVSSRVGSLPSLKSVARDTVVTGTDGSFSFTNVTPGNYTVAALRDGALAAYATSIVVEAERTVTLAELLLTPTGSITGVVQLTGATDHSGAVVYVAGSSFAAFSDQDGAFAITGVPAGSHDIVAARWDYATTRLDGIVVTAGQAIDIGTVQLAPGAVDIVPPEVAITSPTDGADVWGDVTITVAATDMGGVDRIYLFIDGSIAPFGMLVESPFTFVWDTSEFPEGGLGGDHVLMAKAIDRAGNAADSAPVTVSVCQYDLTDFAEILAVDAAGNILGGDGSDWCLGASGGMPFTYAFGPAVPNPASGSASLRFQLPTESHVALQIVDGDCNVRRVLISETLAAGSHEVTWDVKDDAGQLVQSGLYRAFLTAGDFTCHGDIEVP